MVPAISITDSTTLDQMESKMDELYSILMGYAAAKKANLAGPPYCIYHTWNPEGYTKIEAGIPVDKELPDKLNIKGTMSPGGKVVKTLHTGPYDQVEPIYIALEKYIKLNKLEMAGGPWEVYLTCPSTEPDSSKWETLIFYPVK